MVIRFKQVPVPIQILSLMKQCEKMTKITDEAYVFDYSENGMRCGRADDIAKSSDHDLYAHCELNAMEFFSELFRCNIGDHRIRSTQVIELPVLTKVVSSAIRA